MSDYHSYNGTTLANSAYAITFSPNTVDSRPKTPSGLIVAQAAQTKAGWLPQVLVDKAIVWEGEPEEDGDAAVGAANARIVEAIKRMFQLVAPGQS